MKTKNPTAWSVLAFTLGIWLSGLVYGHCYYNPSKPTAARAIANAAGPNVVLQSEHTSFGDRANAGEPLIHSLQALTGGEGEDTHLLFYGYRYYNASTGRWLSRDPLSSESALPREIERESDADENEGISELVVVNNEPLSSIDALGLWPSSSPFLGVDIVASLVHQKANERLPVSAGELFVLNYADAGVDEGAQSQLPRSSYQHAMRNGVNNEADADARESANEWVKDNLSKAEDLLCRCHDAQAYLHALEYFGRALHTVQDSTSPAHARKSHGKTVFRKWFGLYLNPPNVAIHVLRENFDPGYGSQLYRATEEMWPYFQCKFTAPAFPTDFFHYDIDKNHGRSGP